jgi:BASS family bile acid:Na+ symporter
VGQLLLSPLVAVLISRMFDLSDGISLGLILIAAMPGGATAKAFVVLARGSAPLSIAIMVTSTLLAVVTVPLTLQLAAKSFVPAEIVMPTDRIIRDVICFVLAPLGIGMLIGSFAPDRRKVLNRWLIRAGFVVVATMIICALGSRRVRPGAQGFLVPLAIIVFTLVVMQVSMLPFRLLGWPRPDTVSAGMEVTMRNVNLALLLKAGLFPEGGPTPLSALGSEVMFVILFYAGAAFFLGLPLALNFRRMARRDERRGPSVALPAPASK